MSLFDKLNGSPQRPQVTMQDIKNDPVGVGRGQGYNIPDSMGRDPRAIAMHLIQTGQVGGPLLQKVMPMIQRMMGK